jgi:soluble lytic murein transglycosylase
MNLMRPHCCPSAWRLLAVVLPLWACTSTAPPPEPSAEGPSAPSSAEAPPAPAAEAPAPEAVVAPPAEPVPPSLVAVPDPRVAPLAEAAAQGDEAAREELGRLAAAGDGAGAEQAALALGALLVGEERWGEALAPLRQATAGDVAPDAAAVLFARAVVEGSVEAARDEARALIRPVAGGAEGSALAREARLRSFQLEARAGAWGEAARQGLELLAAEPPPARLDEVRWQTAEALRLAGRPAEALELYRAIWLETPGSAWAGEARERLVAAGVEAEPPAGADRLAWVETMQGSGLHREALAELAPLRQAAADPELRRQALAAAARSHWALRENQVVVDVAETLRREAPDSPWAAQAALQAMRALGREDRVEEIRAWEEWLRRTHTEHEAAPEGRYYLGVILGGTPGEEEAGLEILRQVAAGGGERSADALWRIAWIERRLGDDAAARSALEELLASDIGAGYRSAALYWLARLAEPPGGERAVELYRTVRREFPRHYYAMAAAERLRELGLPPRPLAGASAGVDAADGAAAAATANSAALDGAALPHPDPLIDPSRRPEPAYRRAVELAALGLPRLAAAELATLDLEDDPAAALGLARLHHRGGDSWSAIGLLLARFDDALSPVPLGDPAVAREVWETLYPFLYQDAVAAAVERSAPPGLPFDPWLVATVARRESRFFPRAASPAGAVGVLQLMPATAARAAERVGVEPPGRAGLFDPRLNIALGTAELARLVAAFDGEWAPALAAYNAGEQVVRTWWQARPPGQTLDEWIDTIPYVETRLYVKWILGTHPIYRALYPDAAG